MQRRPYYLSTTLLGVCIMSAVAWLPAPEASISNGIIKARLYLPDAAEGYYRGTRFDWAGVMPELRFNGHNYSSVWFAVYEPTINDAIMGPVESFAPLGYDSALAGCPFVQIGVGSLKSHEAAPYTAFGYYPITNAGIWKIKKQPNNISFTHILNDAVYPYEYNKTITLVKGKPVMALSHSLKNTGKQILETNVYNHNLFVFDKQPTGPDFTVQFPFTLHGRLEGQKGLGTTDIASIKDSQVIINRLLQPSESAYTLLYGYSGSEKDYSISIENHKTGAAVKITSDRPLSKLAFWASPTVFSPEPFTHLRIMPGQTFNWNIFYTFYTCSIKP